MKKAALLREKIKQLSIENQELLNIFNHMPDTYYRADLNGVILKVSPSAESLMACKTNDLLGKKLSDFYVDANGREKFLKALLKGKGILHHHEHQVYRVDGEIIWLSTNAQYVYADEKIIGVEGIIRDVTARKKMEENIKDLEKSKALTGLIGGIAHYFNNDLAGMTGALYLSKQTLDEQSRSYQYIQDCEDKIFHMANIIRELLTFSEKAQYVQNNHNLVPLLQDSIHQFQAMQRQPLRIKCHIPADKFIVRCNTKQLSMAFLNILDNAKHALLHASDGCIEVSLQVISNADALKYIHIRMVDYGCGMTEEVLARAVEPFFTTKEVGEGQGLGLSAASGIITQHGGRLKIESSKGLGTQVYIYLPLVAET